MDTQIRGYEVTKWIRRYVVTEYLRIRVSTYFSEGLLFATGYSAVKPPA